MTDYSLRQGGLMRCCIETLDKYDGPDTVGTLVPCIYCRNSILLAPDGVWEWSRAQELRQQRQEREKGLNGRNGKS